jgi:16S rRNA (guanine(527)-N(7))-methyltransferase RsmG
VFPELLSQAVAGIIEVSPAQFAVLEAHYELLKKWNQTLNLTRVENLEEAVRRHYAESLFLAAHLPAGPLSIADIGSGGGFPGFPVAVARPDCSVTLIESHQRKAVFLKEACRSLPSVRVLSQRAEDIGEHFDIAISRAVSYDDLVKPLKKLAKKAVLLTGAEEPPARIPLEWSAVVPLPWGEKRFLRISM